MAKTAEYVWTFERDWLGWHIMLRGLENGIEVTLTKEPIVEHAHTSGYSPNCGACKQEEESNEEGETVDSPG